MGKVITTGAAMMSGGWNMTAISPTKEDRILSTPIPEVNPDDYIISTPLPNPFDRFSDHTGNTDIFDQDIGKDQGFTPEQISLDDYIFTKKEKEKKRGEPAPNLAPPGVGRRGAFRAAKRHAGIPVSRQPDSVTDNINNQEKVVSGKNYNFKPIGPTNMPLDKNGNIVIRDDAEGHVYLDDPTQNRGPHFNTSDKEHFDYGK